LPRNDNGRNKGFGYVEFEERKELITALGMENLVNSNIILFNKLVIGNK